jgi:hypothetical protein
MNLGEGDTVIDCAMVAREEEVDGDEPLGTDEAPNVQGADGIDGPAEETQGDAETPAD